MAKGGAVETKGTDVTPKRAAINTSTGELIGRHRATLPPLWSEETLKWIHATQSLVLLRNIVASGLEGDESAILQVLGELEALRLKGVFCLIEEELSLLERYATECRGELQIRDGAQALVSLVEEALGECYSQSSNASSRDENRAVAYNELRIASAVPLLRKGIN